METQEFDEELQETNRIYKEIGDLNTKELLELQGAITQIKENSQKEKKENTLSWLEQSVISVLKDYAEEIGGTFNSEDDEVGNRIITQRHDGGFDIDSENVRLRMALAVANYTYIGYGDGKSILNLTYDPIVIGK